MSNEAFIMQWDPSKQTVVFKSLPALPEPLANAGIGAIGNTVYVLGGSTGKEASSKVFSLNLKNSSLQWESLPELPVAVSHAAVAAQSNGEHPCIFVMGGRSTDTSGSKYFI
ncbi:MAG: kelch repeat-containing protein [Bacteroidota bacterium]